MHREILRKAIASVLTVTVLFTCFSGNTYAVLYSCRMLTLSN